MILNNINENFDTLGRPLFWLGEETPTTTAIQGVSLVCKKPCEPIYLARYRNDQGHISITFNIGAVERRPLCFFDGALNYDQFVYMLTSADPCFIQGCLVLTYTNNNIDIDPKGVQINPIGIQWLV